MNKTELAKVLAEKAALPQAKTIKIVDMVLEQITKALKKGKVVTFVGFGSFKVAKRAARQGRNPRTGKPLKIPAANVPKFRPGKNLKKAVN